MTRPLDLIGVPSDLGAQNGTSGGPEALRPHLLSALAELGVSAAYVNAAEHQDFPEMVLGRSRSRGKVRYQRRIAKVVDIVADRTLMSLSAGHLPVILGGDHSIAMGSGRAALEFAHSQKKTIGLIWIDAHYDAHTEDTTRSHHANGMPLATLLGYGPRAFRRSRRSFPPGEVLHLGAGTTDCEPEEKALLDKLKVRAFSAEELRVDPTPAWRSILTLVDRVNLVWVSLDLDVVNRAFAPGVHLQNESGIDRDFLLWLGGHMRMGEKFCGVDIMEHKPDNEECDDEGSPKTASLATEFLLELLKK